MIPLSIADIAEITGGSLDCVSDPDQRVTGFIEFDSRKVTKGGLFLACPAPVWMATTMPKRPSSRAQWRCWLRGRWGFRRSSSSPKAA